MNLTGISLTKKSTTTDTFQFLLIGRGSGRSSSKLGSTFILWDVHTARPVQHLDGIRIYRTQAAGNTAQLTDRWKEIDTRFGYHRCTVVDDRIDVEFILGDDQCEEFGTYGPLGHPKVEDRDYSVAQQHPPIEPD